MKESVLISSLGFMVRIHYLIMGKIMGGSWEELSNRWEKNNFERIDLDRPYWRRRRV